jgi:LAO/AO transport system kinase
MEIGDIFVINKKDLPGADKLLAEVEYVLSFKSSGAEAGRKGDDPTEISNPILMTCAVHEDGIEQLQEAIDGYAEEIQSSGRLAEKRRFRLERELLGILNRKVHELMDVHIEVSRQLPEWAEHLYRRESRPYALINEQIHNFLKEKKGD